MAVVMAIWVGLAAAAAPALRWEFDRADEVAGVNNFPYARVSQSRFVGMSTWDPYIRLALPASGITAEEYRTLRARIYSSGPADVLDIYYKTKDGYWCLGGSLKIVPGWAVYTVDLASNAWRETRWPEARRWGGPPGAGPIVVLRIDPGNQGGRWIMIDWVELSPRPAPTAVRPEKKVVVRLVGARLPAAVTGGRPLKVSATWELLGQPPSAWAVAFARLQGREAVVAVSERRVRLDGRRRIEVEFSLPTPTWMDSELSVSVGLYEACGVKGYRDETRRVRVVSPRGTAGFARCEIRQLGGAPAVFVDGRPTPMFCFSGHGEDKLEEGKASWHAAMAQQGITVFSDWFGRSHDGFLGHYEDGTYDYSAFDAYFSAQLQQVPEALFLPHVYVTPPLWWQRKNPEEMCELDDGTKAPMSLASRKWREEMGRDLARLVKHLRSQPYADRIIGLIVCGGYTAEWQTWGLWKDRFADYSAPAVKAWRKWLRERYGNDRRLQEAWGRKNVSIDTAVPPSPQRRRAAGLLQLRDPRADADVIDYLTFLNELTADAIVYFARVVKQASEGRLLFGTYYGYLTQHHYHQAESGHLGIERILEAPEVDFLMSPPLYTDRAVGGVSYFMSATDSVQGHGKLWLSEADYRTYLSDPAAGYGRTETVEDTLNVLWREFAAVLTKRTAVSWMDMEGGWLAGPIIPRELGKMRRLMEDYLTTRKPWRAEVAVFIDPRSFIYVRPDRKLGLYITLWPIISLLRAGAPFDVYVLSDLWKLDLRGYKLYVFLNAYALDSEQRARILRYVRRPGVSSLWHWAAGYAWPEQRRLATPEEMSALVGISLKPLPSAGNVHVGRAVANRYSPCVSGQPSTRNPSLALGPLWVPAGGEALVELAPVGATGLAKAQVDGATVFYSAVPQLPPAVLRQIYRDAGVHVYLDSDDCFYADGSWIAVHAAAGGDVSVTLPAPGAVASVRRDFHAEGRKVVVPMPRHFTELLRRR